MSETCWRWQKIKEDVNQGKKLTDSESQCSLVGEEQHVSVVTKLQTGHQHWHSWPSFSMQTCFAVQGEQCTRERNQRHHRSSLK